MTVKQCSPPLSLTACKSFRSNKTSTSNGHGSKSSKRSTPSSPDIWGVQLVSRAYRDVPYSPVDPWKPSMLYSIRHIHPEIASPAQTPVGTTGDTGCGGDGHTHSPLSTSQFVNDTLNCPFPPVDPQHSTTKPLRVGSKRRVQHSNIEENGDTHLLERSRSYFEGHSRRWSHGSRHLSPYPSPTGGPRSASSHSSHLDEHYSLPHIDSQPTWDDIELHILRPLSDSLPVPPGEHNYTLHSSRTSGSQTLAEGPRRPSASTSQIHLGLSRPHQPDNSTTVTLTANDLYFPPIPILDRPPAPRSRQGVSRPQSELHKPTVHLTDSASSSMKATRADSFATKTYVLAFLLDTLPRQIYLYFLLCLPYLYFSRVAHIFQAAELSLPKIKQEVIAQSRHEHDSYSGDSPSYSWGFGQPVPSPAYLNLQKTWELFIDSLLREWRTLNIISVLLLSAILAILQIESAINDPVIVYTALLSMMCGLMSLIFGCIYIIRFGSMRKVSKAAMWAAEAQRSTTCILWNVWILLAMPATWLAWALVLYICCIMSLVWRTGSAEDQRTWTLSSSQALVPRTTITAVLALGVIYFALIMNTMRRYGHAMDRAWKKLAIGWVQSKRSRSPIVLSSALNHRVARRDLGPSPLSTGLPRSESKSLSSSDTKSTTNEHV